VDGEEGKIITLLRKLAISLERVHRGTKDKSEGVPTVPVNSEGYQCKVCFRDDWGPPRI